MSATLIVNTLLETFDPDAPDGYLDQVAPAGVTPGQHQALLQRGFRYMGSTPPPSTNGHEYSQRLGKHKWYVIVKPPITSDEYRWFIVDYTPTGSAQSGHGSLERCLELFDRWKTQYDQRRSHVHPRL